MQTVARRIEPVNADLCESPELADQNPNVERIQRRLCRIEVLADAYIAGLRRLATEREQLEAELAAIDAEAQK